ncbi:hypothetical protein Csa_008653 [Cucumis sativus]|nr:hypothetical protein Csa_008653 [Cucumis sativus]
MEDNKERKFMIKAHLREKNNGFLESLRITSIIPLVDMEKLSKSRTSLQLELKILSRKGAKLLDCPDLLRTLIWGHELCCLVVEEEILDHSRNRKLDTHLERNLLRCPTYFLGGRLTLDLGFLSSMFSVQDRSSGIFELVGLSIFFDPGLDSFSLLKDERWESVNEVPWVTARFEWRDGRTSDSRPDHAPADIPYRITFL